MKKVVFLIQDFDLPSSRVRVLNLLPELSDFSIVSQVARYPKSFLGKLKMLRVCLAADVVVVQKCLPSYLDMFLIRRASRKIVFDFDDAIYCRQNSTRDYKKNTRYKKFLNTLAKADCVLAGNSVLAEAATVANGNIEVIPSAVETRHEAINDHDKSEGPVVIGWIGTSMTLPYLVLLTPVFQALSRSYKIELRIVCSESIDMPGVKIRFVPWSLQKQEKEIAKFDIGVMPLPAQEYASGKCGYKALQYMAASVPPVVSDVGVNRELVMHGESGLVCECIDGFYDAIKMLIEDHRLRKHMGRKARQRVEEFYSIPVVAEKMARCLNKL